jgi:hypothetical protein
VGGAFLKYRNIALTLKLTVKYKAILPFDWGLLQEQKNISLQALGNPKCILQYVEFPVIDETEIIKS